MTIRSTPYGTCIVTPDHLRAGDIIGYGRGTVEIISIVPEAPGYRVRLKGPWRTQETTWKAKGREVELYLPMRDLEAR